MTFRVPSEIGLELLVAACLRVDPGQSPDILS